MSDQQQSILECKALSKRFEDAGRIVDVFSDINLTIKAGECVGILGVSGAGKSTFLHLLGGLDTPTSGEVLLAGCSVASMKERAKSQFRNNHLGFIYQFHHLLPEFNALENIVIPQMINGLIKSAAEKRAIQLLNMVNLENRKLHRPGQLSGGEQQRISIARALSNAPTVLLADEPTGNLDPATAADVFAYLKQIIYATNTAALIVTHNMKLAANMDEMLEMRNGTIVKVMG